MTDTDTAYYVEILEWIPKTDSQVTKTLGPYPTMSIAERAERGIERNLDHDRFWARVTVTEKTDD